MLKQVGHRGNLRAGDWRFGGDEFLVLLPASAVG